MNARIKTKPTANDKYKVLSHSRETDSNLKGILEHIENGDLVSAKCTVLTLQENVLGLQQYLSTTITAGYYNEHRTADSTIAVKVFAIPELFEAIIQQLEFTDILRCYEVRRQFRDSIDSSSRLQVRLFLRAAPKASSIEFPPNSSNLSFEHRQYEDDEYEDLDEKIVGQTTVIIKAKRDENYSLPNIGERLMRMLIRQPPIYEMSCQMGCFPIVLHDRNRGMTASGNKSHRMSQYIRSEDGLTVQDLYEAARALFEQHRDCQERREWERRHVVFHECFAESGR